MMMERQAELDLLVIIEYLSDGNPGAFQRIKDAA
jgi:hypothetical protein